MNRISDWPEFDDVPPGHGCIAVMDYSGDTKTTWDPTNPDEVAVARDTFTKLQKKGYTAFSVKPGGEKNKRIGTFDPEAGMLIMVPAVQGGL